MSNYNTLKTADTINAISIVDGAITTSKLNNSVTTLIGSGGGPKATAITYPGNDLAADPAGGQTIAITGTGFVAGCSVFVGTVQATVVTVVSATSVTFTSPALAAGTYTLYVVNPDGGTATIVPGISYSGTPAWTTGAGTLGSVYEYAAISNTLAATGDGSITYSVFSGTLPTGSVLNTSTGVITGTSPASAGATTYTFVIRATDAQLQDSDRSFSITVNTDVVTWTTPAANSVTTLGKDVASSTTLLATSAAGRAITYTANALPTGLSIVGDAVTGTPTVAASTTSTFTATAATTGKTATATINWTVSLASDTYFAYTTLLLGGSASTATFVTDASTNNFVVAITGDTKPNNFNPYTPGYYSNYFDGSSNFTSSTSQIIPTGSFTVECWVYVTSTSNQVFVAQGTSGNAARFCLAIDANLWQTQIGNASINIGTPIINAWNYIAVTFNGSTLTLYVNGTSIGTVSTSTSAQNTTLVIGTLGPSWAAGYFVTGYISNVRVSSVVRTIVTPTAPYTSDASTRLLTCQSNRFLDNSTNAFALTITGTPSVQSSTPFVPNTAYAAYGSTYFDGTGDYLSVADNANLEVGSGDFTLEGWFYATAAGAGDNIIVAKCSAAYAPYWVSFYGGNSIKFCASSTNGGWDVANNISFGAPTLTTWNHFAVSRSGTAIQLFLNGVLGATVTTSAALTDHSAPFTVGSQFNGGNPFTGYISNVRLVKGTAVYTAAFTPPTAPLTAIANTSLLTLQTNQPVNNSVFLDSSTNAFAVTRAGNTTQGTSSPYGANWSNYFSSANYISAASNAAFGFGTGDFTVEAWVYPNAAYTTYNYIWATGVTTGLVFYVLGGVLYVRTYNGSDILASSTAPAINTWTHVAATRSGTTLRIFVNGVQTGTTTNSTNFATGSGIVGNDGANAAPWLGYISNLRVVKGTAVYTSNFTPSITPLTAIANTSLLTCQSNSLVDNSANAFAITKTGDVAVQRFSPFSPLSQTANTHSAYFDGTGDYLSTTVNLAIATGPFTMEAWIYLTALGTERYIFNNLYWQSGNNGGWSLTTDSSNRLWLRASTNTFNTRTTVILSSSIFAVGTWYHVAVVRDSNNLVSMYFNGVSAATPVTYAASLNQGTGQVFRIGAWTPDGGVQDAWLGYISNARVVVGTAVYTSNFTPSTAPLTAVTGTSLLTCQSPTFVDNSTNAFAITAVGDAKPRTQNPFGFTSATAAYSAATYGGSAYFDGTDYLSLANNAAFQFGTGDFTVELYYYPTALTGSPANSQVIIGMWGGGTSQSSWVLYFLNGTLYWYTSTNGSTQTATLSATSGMSINNWYHLALVRSSGTTTIYVNGTSIGSTGTVVNLYAASCTLTIGYNSVGGTPDYVYGYLSDVRIVKSTALYTSNFVPPTAPLTSVKNSTLLLNMTSASVYDSASMNNLETVGDAKISTAQSKFGGSSMSFDGTSDYLSMPSSPNLNIGTSDFTIELWFYIPGGITSPLAIIGNGNVGSIDNAYWTLEGVAGGNIGFFAANSATQYFATTTQPWTAGWAHIAVSRSGNNSRLFVNGVQQGSTYTTNNSFAAGGNLYIGTGPYSVSARAMPLGYINDVRITKGYARYTTNFAPPTTAFIAR